MWIENDLAVKGAKREKSEERRHGKKERRKERKGKEKEKEEGESEVLACLRASCLDMFGNVWGAFVPVTICTGFTLVYIPFLQTDFYSSPLVTEGSLKWRWGRARISG